MSDITDRQSMYLNKLRDSHGEHYCLFCRIYHEHDIDISEIFEAKCLQCMKFNKEAINKCNDTACAIFKEKPEYDL